MPDDDDDIYIYIYIYIYMSRRRQQTCGGKMPPSGDKQAVDLALGSLGEEGELIGNEPVK